MVNLMDQDLRRGIWALRLLTVANLGSAGINTWAGNYLVAISNVIWALCCAVQIQMAHNQQRTRDMVRLVNAAQRIRSEEEA
jgi:hypothetical protein